MALADMTGPSLDGLQLQQSVDVTTGDALAAFTVTASDDASGIDYLSLRFDHIFQTQFGPAQSIDFYSSVDSFATGTATRNEVFTSDTAAGTYSVTAAYLYDKAGNYAAYSAADLRAAGFDIDFVVSSRTAPDTTAPTLTGFTLQQTVDVTSGDAVASFTASASDTGSGIDHVSLVFDKPFETQYGRSQAVSFSISDGSFADGAGAYDEVLTSATAAGLYSVSAAYVYDQAGNVAYYSAAELMALGLDTDFVVTSATIVDTTRPTLTGFGLQQVVDVTNGTANATFTASASDTGSGIDFITLLFDRPFQTEYGRSDSIIFDSSDADFAEGGASVSELFTRATAAGTYNLTEINVYDKAGNASVYSGAELRALGFDTDFFVQDRNVTPTPTISASVPAYVVEGRDAFFTPSLTFRNVGDLSAQIEVSYSTLSSAANGADISVPNQTYTASASRTPAGDYTVNLAQLGIVNDDVAEGDELIAIRIKVPGQVFADGSDTTIVQLRLVDDDIDPLAYLASNRDVLAAVGIDLAAARAHYLTYGIAEGRTATGFDASLYAASNPDLARAFGTDSAQATLHYLNYGIAEGRPTSGFDPYLYGASNLDVARATGGDPAALTRHYLMFGADEGRAVASFDALEYAASNPDVARILGTNVAALAAHYVIYGLAEGRAADSFDALEYAATNTDIARILGSDAAALELHYISFGIGEGRATTGFDPVAYLLSNADLGAAGLDAGGALRHWIDAGIAEGRVGDSLFGREQASHVAVIDGVTRGTVDQARDRDWYGLTLHAGETVTLDLATDQTSDPAGRGLADPVMTVFDAHGRAVAFDDNSGPGKDAAIRYTAESGGTYYIEAAGVEAFGFFAVGGYALTIHSDLVI